MRELIFSEQCKIASTLAELARSRYDKGATRADAVKFSNADIGKAIPREWYNGPEEIHLNREAKATIPPLDSFNSKFKGFHFGFPKIPKGVDRWRL